MIELSLNEIPDFVWHCVIDVKKCSGRRSVSKRWVVRQKNRKWVGKHHLACFCLYELKVALVVMVDPKYGGNKARPAIGAFVMRTFDCFDHVIALAPLRRGMSRTLEPLCVDFSSPSFIFGCQYRCEYQDRTMLVFKNCE